VRGVAVDAVGTVAKLHPQDDGTLNRGALQDYGLTRVPELEKRSATLIAEMSPQP
jgi:hypothetical protein